MSQISIADHSHSSHEHIVQLFDASRSLADATATYLQEGWDAGDQLLVITKAKHWRLIAGYLHHRECPAFNPSTTDRISVLNARRLLDGLMVQGKVDVGRAREVLHANIERCRRPGTRLRAYGELVELLAEESNLEAVFAIEDLWNELIAKTPLTLLCGYSAAHFADPRNADALSSICHKHSRVQTQSADALGSWLTESCKTPA